MPTSQNFRSDCSFVFFHCKIEFFKLLRTLSRSSQSFQKTSEKFAELLRRFSWFVFDAQVLLIIIIIIIIIIIHRIIRGWCLGGSKIILPLGGHFLELSSWRTSPGGSRLEDHPKIPAIPAILKDF